MFLAARNGLLVLPLRPTKAIVNNAVGQVTPVTWRKGAGVKQDIRISDFF